MVVIGALQREIRWFGGDDGAATDSGCVNTDCVCRPPILYSGEEDDYTPESAPTLVPSWGLGRRLHSGIWPHTCALLDEYLVWWRQLLIPQYHG